MRFRSWLAAFVFAHATAATAQYPEKPITFVVPFAAGSATDQLARAIGQEVTAQTKQPVVIDNKAGASGFIGAQQVAKAAPDGYTVFITTNTTHAANEHLFKSIPYDPVKDFAPVTGLAKGGQILLVAPNVQAKSVQELIAFAKANPGKVSFGSGSSSSRIAGELFQQMAGVKLLHVPYKSNPQAVSDLLGGQISMMITDVATGLPQVKGGKLRALGVSSLNRIALVPDVPTISEAGVKGYEMSFWFAAYVPAKTPPAVVQRLQTLLVNAVKGPATKSLFESTGLEPFTTHTGGAREVPAGRVAEVGDASSRQRASSPNSAFLTPANVMAGTLRIGSGAGFSGDRLDAAVELLERGELDVLALECLAERTIALAQLRRRKDPSLGYDPRLARRIEPLLPSLRKRGVRLLSNLGAANPARRRRRDRCRSREGSACR